MTRWFFPSGWTSLSRLSTRWDDVCQLVGAQFSEVGTYCWWFRNPAPVEVGSLSHYLRGFVHPRWWSPDFWTINTMWRLEIDLIIGCFSPRIPLTTRIVIFLRSGIPRKKPWFATGILGGGHTQDIHCINLYSTVTQSICRQRTFWFCSRSSIQKKKPILKLLWLCCWFPFFFGKCTSLILFKQEIEKQKGTSRWIYWTRPPQKSQAWKAWKIIFLFGAWLHKGKTITFMRCM